MKLNCFMTLCDNLLFSLLNIFLLIPRLVKRFYNSAILNVSACLGLDRKENYSANSLHLNNGHVVAQELKTSARKKTTSNSVTIHEHLNKRGDIEHILVDESQSNDLIDDVICDNIILKSRLEKVCIETASLKRNLEEINDKVEEINDMCDVLVGGKISPGAKNNLNCNSKSTATTKSKTGLLIPLIKSV